MPKNNGFMQVEWTGLKELVDFYGSLETAFDRELKKEMKDYVLLVETGARALAHRYGGDLEESIIAAEVAVKNGMVIGEVGSNLVYAWRRHEEPYRRGKHPLYDNGIRIDNYYKDGLGARTRGKSSWRGQMPGRKFLSRTVTITEADFAAGMSNALKRALGGAR